MKKLLSLLLLTLALTVHAKPITAKSWLIYENGSITSGQNTKEVRSIASITKLVTTMVYLDAKTGKNQDLIQRAIVSSDNRAARTLCDSYPGGKEDCIFMMNLKAKELGLTNTKFVEPTGLSVFNISTAEDLVKIVEAASKYPEIVNASQIRSHNTNPTIGKYHYIVSKTGYINKAGGCIVAKVDNKIVVILGSKNVKTRIPELEHLLRL
jgi:D-alanyl-D-alanine carboxypeptidase